MGEDETLPRNRFALICNHCKLVNGQAPPGTKSLSEVGKWRCFECRDWNGEENEAARIVAEVQEEAKAAASQHEKALDTATPTTPEATTSDEVMEEKKTGSDETDQIEERKAVELDEQLEESDEKPPRSESGRPRRRVKKAT
jgi:hypothetical protein